MKSLVVLVALLICAISLQAQEDDALSTLVHSLSQVDVRLWYDEIHTIDDEESYDDLETRVFAWLNWGAEEIAWFRDVYSIEHDPHDYIEGIAEAMTILDALP